MEPDIKTLPLPDYAHIPGVNSRPDLTFLESISAYAPLVTVERQWKTNLPWLYGIQLFNSGYYWEAHEVWETVWMNAPPNSREKQFVQGVIHFANGLLKVKMKRGNAARRLFALAHDTLEQAVAGRGVIENAHFMGVGLADLRQDLLLAESKIGSNDFDPKLKYEI